MIEVDEHDDADDSARRTGKRPGAIRFIDQP
jgi:hypothetical protein